MNQPQGPGPVPCPAGFDDLFRAYTDSMKRTHLFLLVTHNQNRQNLISLPMSSSLIDLYRVLEQEGPLNHLEYSCGEDTGQIPRQESSLLRFCVQKLRPVYPEPAPLTYKILIR